VHGECDDPAKLGSEPPVTTVNPPRQPRSRSRLEPDAADSTGQGTATSTTREPPDVFVNRTRSGDVPEGPPEGGLSTSFRGFVQIDKGGEFITITSGYPQVGGLKVLVMARSGPDFPNTAPISPVTQVSGAVALGAGDPGRRPRCRRALRGHLPSCAAVPVVAHSATVGARPVGSVGSVGSHPHPTTRSGPPERGYTATLSSIAVSDRWADHPGPARRRRDARELDSLVEIAGGARGPGAFQLQKLVSEAAQPAPVRRSRDSPTRRLRRAPTRHAR